MVVKFWLNWRNYSSVLYKLWIIWKKLVQSLKFLKNCKNFVDPCFGSILTLTSMIFLKNRIWVCTLFFPNCPLCKCWFPAPQWLKVWRNHLQQAHRHFPYSQCLQICMLHTYRLSRSWSGQNRTYYWNSWSKKRGHNVKTVL